MKLPAARPASLILLLLTGPLSAQTFSSDVTVTSPNVTAPNLRVTGNGGVLFSGTGSTTGTVPATGPGTRLVWHPAKRAFRAGVVSGTQWDEANVGPYSAAFGIDNLVSSHGSFASGSQNTLSGGWWASAFGAANTLSNSTGTLVSGNSNLSIDHYGGFIAGNFNAATKSVAVAIGEGNISSGWGAMTIGRGLTSAAAGCVVVGMSNEPLPGDPGDPLYWVGTDPIFVVGNGTANSTQTPSSAPVQSNALVILKNGTVKIPKRQGDIQMGEFGNPGSGD